MSKKKSPEKKRLLEWKRYLENSRLSPAEQNKRAKEFTRKGMNAPND
jgi:hypothetical protein